MSKVQVTCDTIRAGQVRDYGPTQHEAVLTMLHVSILRKADGLVPWDAPEYIVKQYVRTFVGNYQDEGEGDWASPRLKSLVKEGPGVWRAVVESAYTD